MWSSLPKFLFASTFFLLAFLPGVTQEYGEQINEITRSLDQEEYEKVVKKVNELLDDDGLNRSRLYHLRADAYYFLNDVPASLDSYLLAIDQLSEHKLDSVHLLEVYSHAGFCYKYLGKYLESVPLYRKAHSIASAMGESQEIANQSYNLGASYLELAEFAKSREFLEMAYRLDSERMDTAALGYDLSSLGDLMIKSKNYEEAITYYREAIRIKRTLANNVNTESLRLGKLAQAFALNDQIDSAKFYNLRAIQMATDARDSLSLAKHKIDQARILLSSRDHRGALLIIEEAVEYFQAIDAGAFLVKAGIVKAEALMELKPSRALEQVEDLISLAKANGLIEEFSHILLLKTSILELLNKSEKALQTYKEYQAVQDSLIRNQQVNTAILLTNEYEEAQKASQIALLLAQEQLSQERIKRRSRTIIFLSILLVVTILLAILVIIHQRKRNKLKGELLSLEINELRLQIRQLLDYKPEQSTLAIEKLNQALDAPLSEREFEVLQMALSEKNNSEIAEKIFVSTNTVKFHLKNIYQKLGVSSRKEALKFAMQATSE